MKKILSAWFISVVIFVHCLFLVLGIGAYFNQGDMMKITIELRSNTSHGLPTKAEIQKNIDALDQVVNGKLTIENLSLMNDTRSILEAIQRQL